MNKQTAQLLEKHFDTAFAAPDGIAKLRELILTLAMQGKLVEQDANDAPASELLREIEAEKQRPISSSSPRRRGSSGLKGLDPRLRGNDGIKIKPEEAPYPLPQGWEWVRLGDICSYIQRGKGPKYVEVSTHRVISQKCVRWYGLDLEPARYIDPASLEKYEPIRFLRVGDLLWNSTGTGTIGRACLVPQDLEGVEIVADSHVTVVRPIEVRPVFLWRWIQSPTVQNEIEGSASGTTNQIELNTSTVINHLMPLPPLPEQHRIVARIDQLMARCDALEKLRKEREEKRLAVHAAAIKQLLDAPDGLAWDFIQQHFGELYTVKENVAELRKAILQLAVMGRLVSQDPNDPPASELLKEIEKKTKTLLKSRKVKYREVTENPDIQAMKYPVPNNWVWTRFKDVVFFQEGPGIRNWQFTDQGVKLLNVSNILFDDNLDLSNSDKYVSEEEFLEKYQHFEIEEGDLLFAGSGASWGKLAWYKDPGYRVMLNTSTMRLRFFHEGFANNYLFYFIKSEFFKSQLARQLVGLQPNFGSTHMNRVYIPIPPLPEQHRIVARIDQLMALCDTLDQQIDAATGKQTQLLNAVMAQV